MFDQPTREAYQKELTALITARLSGNEGKARVCARRAAGIAARAFCNILGIHYENPSAISVLNLIHELDLLPETTRQHIDRLLLQVDTNHRLPENIDLEVEANALVADLEALITGG